MKDLGFTPFSPGELVKARFSHVAVFAVEGMTVASTESDTVKINGHFCKFAISPKVNDACQALLSSDYTSDEAEWQNKYTCSGAAYALIAIGPTDEYEANSGLIKQDADGSIITYNCFPSVKTLLKEVGNDVLPELLTALTCTFFTPGRHFRIHHVHSSTFGITSDGRIVHDILITGSAHGFAPSPRALKPYRKA